MRQNSQAAWTTSAMGLLLTQQPLAAQQAAAHGTPSSQPAEPQAKALEKVEATGSRIRRLDTEGPSPVVTIDRAQIDHSGAATLTTWQSLACRSAISVP